MKNYTLSINSQPNSAFFPYLLALTGVLLLFEIGFFVSCNSAYLADFNLVAAQLKIPTSVLPGIIFFILAQLLLHLAFVLVIWFTARSISKLVGLDWQATTRLGFRLWILAVITVLLANQVFFPNSKFSALTGTLVSAALAKPVLVGCGTLLSIALILGAISAVFTKFQAERDYWSLLVGFLLIASVLEFFAYQQNKQLINVASVEKPNIFIIGIDSLRPDHLQYFGDVHKATPHIDDFLKNATVFTHSITPLARTYPAWVSILTGEYPLQVGARTNLMDQTHLELNNTLPNILRDYGYETFYATDETRFSNIDKKFGFDHTIIAPMGFNDFLLGTMNDFPLSNLIVNTPVGKFLFPYSYANRSAFITYEPNTFIKRLAATLKQPHAKPIFLAVHFCLPHYPYMWANYHWHKNTPEADQYSAAVHAADRQFENFMKFLNKSGFLEHSIVVLLSDHGEAFELAGDRVTEAQAFIPGAANKIKSIPQFYPAAVGHEAVDQSAGHGTDVLGFTQYHTVLAIKVSGAPPTQIGELASLIDIKPTVLGLLKIPDKSSAGISFAENMSVQPSLHGQIRDIFTESDFSPQAIRTVHPDVRQVMFSGVHYFQIDPKTTRLTVKKNMSDLIISSKQYADYYNSWLLALYPQKFGVMTPILVNLKTGQWTNDLTTDFAKASPASHMLVALKSFYGKDIKTIE